MLGAAQAWGQAGPHVGYVYPAGGRQGTVVRVTVGGQGLGEPAAVYVSGTGVSASVVDFVRPLTDQERSRTATFLRDLVRRRWSAQVLAAPPAEAATMAPLPDHPWLRDLDDQNPREIANLRARLFNPKSQPNAQLAEQVEIAVTLDAAAPPGDRELRLVTAGGLSNPLRFEVSALPEVRAEEIVSPGQGDAVPADLPVVLNGQITPGDTDRFRLRARQGQQLVVRAEARRLMPYLADAVPGWFQAAVALSDPQGHVVARADHWRFDQDPVLFYTVPADGVYGLEVRDALYRGREDFVYRVTVGELPCITRIFPLGGREGTPTVATLAGVNLPAQSLELDTTPGGGAIRQATAGGAPGRSNAVRYAVDTLPEALETEPNDTAATAQKVALGTIINGRIGKPGDLDVFRFDGHAGDEIVAEVWARRLDSPLDGALQLVNAAGEVVAANDDHDDPEFGLLTHQADPYLRLKLPADGAYWVYLRDAERQGGEDYAYRLHLRAAQPDFALRVTPSSLTMPGRRAATATVRVVRKDGWDGDIEVVLKDAPAGFTLAAAKIPAGKDTVQVVLMAPKAAPYQQGPVRLEGRATMGGAVVTRPVVAAEDMMQAFAYRSLVPQQELVVAITGSRAVPAVWRPLVAGMKLASAGPVKIPRGGTVEVQVNAPRTLPDNLQTPLGQVRFAVGAAAPGVRLAGARLTPTGVALTLKADANSTLPGLAGNLIVEAYTEAAGGRRVTLGVLPAVGFEEGG